MGTHQILYRYVMLPYTEEYQQILKYRHALYWFNSVSNLGGVVLQLPNSEQELVCCC